MSTVYLAADEVTDGAADQRVGGEVLVGSHAGCTDSGGATIGDKLRQRTGIFACDHRCDRDR
jgi:hypothetical protein